MRTNLVDNYDFITSTTLGRPKDFLWKLDNENCLHIIREFGKAKSINDKKITEQELEKINNFVQANKWTDLSNSISKLPHGTEKDGLGKFLYNELNWSNTHAQLASQLGAIFTIAGVWIYNGKRRGIQFRGTAEDWKKEIRTYYQNHLGGKK